MTLVAVPVDTTEPGFRAGRTEELFHSPLWPNMVDTDEFVPSPDGQRFLVTYSIDEAGPSTPITVVINWQAAMAAGR